MRQRNAGDVMWSLNLRSFSALSLLNCLPWAKCSTYWKCRNDKCAPFSQGCLQLVGDTGLCVCNRDLFVFIQERRWVSPGAQVSQAWLLPNRAGKGV